MAGHRLCSCRRRRLFLEPTPFAQALATIFIGCALANAGVFYGRKQALVFFLLCVAITFAMKNLGAGTGSPFANYHFAVDAGLPRVGRIPIIVGPLWFGAGYFLDRRRPNNRTSMWPGNSTFGAN